MNYVIIIISIIFLYINYKIIISDINKKLIPNKYIIYLLLLIPFFYFYLFLFTDIKINILFFCIQILLSFLISFILYFFGIWSAGDAKYLLVLSLFIPQISMITFIGNIAILTIIYLFLYFIYFYFGRCLFNWKYTKSLYKNIFFDLSGKFKSYVVHKDGKIYKNTIIYKIIKWVLLFLIIFVSIRLLRLYIIQHYLIINSNSGGIWKYIINLMIQYNTYFIFISTIIFFLSIYFFIKLLNFLKGLIIKKFSKGEKKINPIIIDIFFIGILFFALLTYIFIEFIKNPLEISQNLYKIFTLYLILYFVFKILRYSYKITFQLGEQDYIDINKLKEGDIIDKEYLINILGSQNILGATGEKQNIKGLFHPDPKKFILEIENPINLETKKILINAYDNVNLYHIKEKTINFQKINSIKILKTFSFGIYIFLGFITSFLIGNLIYKYLLNILFEYLKIKY